MAEYCIQIIFMFATYCRQTSSLFMIDVCLEKNHFSKSEQYYFAKLHCPCILFSPKKSNISWNETVQIAFLEHLVLFNSINPDDNFLVQKAFSLMFFYKRASIRPYDHTYKQPLKLVSNLSTLLEYPSTGVPLSQLSCEDHINDASHLLNIIENHLGRGMECQRQSNEPSDASHCELFRSQCKQTVYLLVLHSSN